MEQHHFVLVPHSNSTVAYLNILAQLVERWQKKGTLIPARITQNHLQGSTAQNLEIRSDFTIWLSDALKQSDLSDLEKSTIELLQRRLSATTETLKDFFRFPLNSYESHFAAYPVGHSYARHCDQTKTNNRRHFSFVIYLNSNWKSENGGQLVLYPENNEPIQILPKIEHMIFFKSDLEHEVQIGTRPRYSITGWIRND